MMVVGGGAARGQEGIFADFTTSMGAFTVQLDHVRASRAVASFVGLATGESGWLDEHTNLVRRPFYDGSIFHRVVKVNGQGLAIQGGGYLYRTTDTNGVVTTNFAGPGYMMLESVNNGLSHSNGVISMANSGPNTDGSQFFITATNMPNWDGNYTVFGRVSTGMSVVAAIAAVAVQGAGDRPVEDVVLSQVVIRREGEAAAAFDIFAQGVPSPESTPMRVQRDGSDLLIQMELASQTKPLKWVESPDLQSWEQLPLLTNIVLAYTGATQVLNSSAPLSVLGDTYFFHSSRLRYPVPITSPASQRARRFTFKWEDSRLTYQVTFATNWWEQGGGWIQVGTNAAVPHVIFYGDTWKREAYMGRLYFMDDLAQEYSYNLGFNPGQTTNRFTGYWKHTTSNVRNAISGTFTMD